MTAGAPPGEAATQSERGSQRMRSTMTNARRRSNAICRVVLNDEDPLALLSHRSQLLALCACSSQSRKWISQLSPPFWYVACGNLLTYILLATIVPIAPHRYTVISGREKYWGWMSGGGTYHRHVTGGRRPWSLRAFLRGCLPWLRRFFAFLELLRLPGSLSRH